MADSHPMLPDLSSMIQAARDIVFTARRQNQLSSLTVKSVRKQVIRDFGLDESFSDKEDIKLAIRNAVNDAVSAELPKSLADKPAGKRKRSPEDTDGIQDSMPHRGVSVSKLDSKGRTIGKEKGSKKKPRVTAKNKKMIYSDDVSSPNEPGSSSRKQNIQDGSSRSKTKVMSKHESSSSVAAPLSEAEKSESELSVLIDPPPKKKRTVKKAKEQEAVPRKTAKSQKKESPTASDNDEATVKRLKSFVSACGVRKVWSKEFSDLPTAKQQIRRLKDILAEVGMDGKYSMEKARVIREKRELARELDDVLEFERKAGASRSRMRQTTKRRIVGELDTESEAEDSSESEEPSTSPVAKRNKSTASKSIMAYLANQSSDED